MLIIIQLPKELKIELFLNNEKIGHIVDKGILKASASAISRDSITNPNVTYASIKSSYSSKVCKCRISSNRIPEVDVSDETYDTW